MQRTVGMQGGPGSPMMTGKGRAIAGAVWSLAWLIGCVLLSTVAAWIYVQIRGPLLPNGSYGEGMPIAFWVSENFRYYLPTFWLAGAAVGTINGIAHAWLWSIQTRDYSA